MVIWFKKTKKLNKFIIRVFLNILFLIPDKKFILTLIFESANLTENDNRSQWFLSK